MTDTASPVLPIEQYQTALQYLAPDFPEVIRGKGHTDIKYAGVQLSSEDARLSERTFLLFDMYVERAIKDALVNMGVVIDSTNAVTNDWQDNDGRKTTVIICTLHPTGEGEIKTVDWAPYPGLALLKALVAHWEKTA